MWRSRARALLLRSPRHAPIRRQVPLETLTSPLPPPPIPLHSKWAPINPRPFSSVTKPSFDSEESGASDDIPPSIPQESAASSVDLASGSPNEAGFGQTPSWDFGSQEPGDPSLLFDEGKDGEAATIDGDDPASFVAPEELTVAVPHEVDGEQVENVLSVLQGSLQAPLDVILDEMNLALSEEFVARVIETPQVPAENLVGFVKWAFEYDESVKSSRVIELLTRAVSGSANLSKKEAYLVWDLVKEIGKEKGLLTTGIVNLVISMFWKLGKARAGLEVFDKMPEFGCDPDGSSYYFTIQALRTRSLLDSIWCVCEKMLESGRFPDGEKTGEIITFFCREDKHKEAHRVYSKAKAKSINIPRSSLDYLIGSLSRNGKTVYKALKLLKDYSGESPKYANKSFSTVIRCFCMIKDLDRAKKLLLEMVASGPPPGSAAFNHVITAVSKEGDMEDALALVKVMESRGLRPDVYTYSVIMSGFAKGGLMEEAHKIFREAKKRHPKLTPVTYHILTRGYCKMEEYDKAIDCLKEMKEDGLQPNIDEYNKMIQTLCLKALDWRTAEKLLEEMKESGLHLKGTTRSLIASVKELAEEVATESVELEAV